MPKKTTAVIIESGNDYLIGVKKNQLTLYNKIADIINDRNNHSSSFVTMEVNRGRTEWRSTITSNKIESISKEWIGLKQAVNVIRVVYEKGIYRTEQAYFISSSNENAVFHAEGVRGHWAIENGLHWVKDVTLKEDASLIKKGDAPKNISTIKNIALNIFRTNNYTNIAQGIRLVANDIKKIFKMVT